MRREPIGSIIIAVPVIVCLAWAMAAQSLAVRQGYSILPDDAASTTTTRNASLHSDEPLQLVSAPTIAIWDSDTGKWRPAHHRR